jgi:hypothetical protein
MELDEDDFLVALSGPKIPTPPCGTSQNLFIQSVVTTGDCGCFDTQSATIPYSPSNTAWVGTLPNSCGSVCFIDITCSAGIYTVNLGLPLCSVSSGSTYTGSGNIYTVTFSNLCAGMPDAPTFCQNGTITITFYSP